MLPWFSFATDLPHGTPPAEIIRPSPSIHLILPAATVVIALLVVVVLHFHIEEQKRKILYPHYLHSIPFNPIQSPMLIAKYLNNY